MSTLSTRIAELEAAKEYAELVKKQLQIATARGSERQIRNAYHYAYHYAGRCVALLDRVLGGEPLTTLTPREAIAVVSERGARAL